MWDPIEYGHVTDPNPLGFTTPIHSVPADMSDMVVNKKPKLADIDMISNLPEEVTNEILKRMHIKDVVKTSLLSTQWRYRWTSIRELVFESHHQRRYRTYKDDEKSRMFVSNVLLLHTDRISKFELNYFLDNGCYHINLWILVLARRKSLYHLALAFNRPGCFYELPASIFSCEALRTLRFEGCLLRRVPSKFKGFSHLTDLDLDRVKLSMKTFETLISKTPLLEKLKVIDCQNLRHININNAPNLKVVHIVGLHCESISFQNTPSLINMKLSLPNTTSRLDQVLAGLHELQVVDINFPYNKTLPVDDAPQGLPITYPHLTCAILMLNFEDSSQILQLLCFCRSSPCLEILDITALNEKEPTPLYEECFGDERLYAENVFHHLKTMNFRGFTGQQHEMEFSQFILLNAVVLETFNIFWGYGSPALTVNGKTLAVQKITQFQRASTTVKLAYI